MRARVWRDTYYNNNNMIRRPVLSIIYNIIMCASAYSECIRYPRWNSYRLCILYIYTYTYKHILEKRPRVQWVPTANAAADTPPNRVRSKAKTSTLFAAVSRHIPNYDVGNFLNNIYAMVWSCGASVHVYVRDVCTQAHESLNHGRPTGSRNSIL